MLVSKSRKAVEAVAYPLCPDPIGLVKPLAHAIASPSHLFLSNPLCHPAGSTTAIWHRLSPFSFSHQLYPCYTCSSLAQSAQCVPIHTVITSRTPLCLARQRQPRHVRSSMQSNPPQWQQVRTSLITNILLATVSQNSGTKIRLNRPQHDTDTILAQKAVGRCGWRHIRRSWWYWITNGIASKFAFRWLKIRRSKCQRWLGQNIDKIWGFPVFMFALFEYEHYLLWYLGKVQAIKSRYWDSGWFVKEKLSICITYEISESVCREGSALSDDFSKLCECMDFHNTNRGRIFRRGFVVRHVGSVDTMNEEP